MSRTLPRLPAVLLRHDRSTGSHFDWLMARPDDPRGLLWAGRVRVPSCRWRRRRSWIVTLLPPHRRRYLRYQGPLAPLHGQDRGRVTRIDQGYIQPRQWSGRRIVVQVQFVHFTGIIELTCRDARTWRARIVPGAICP